MKILFLFIGTGLIVLVAVVLLRTMMLTSKQVQGGPATYAALDSRTLVGRLARSIQFKTISYQDPAQSKSEEFTGLHQFLDQAFPHVHETLKREVVAEYSLLYTWKGQDERLKPLLLMAHMDVVPAESQSGSGWTYPAFEGRIADGYLWGRGTLDDKDAMLGILESVERLLQEGYAPRRTIYLAFGHDEEVGGQSGAASVAALLYSRGIKLDYVLDEGLTIVEGVVPNITKPVALVGVAEKGYVSIEMTVESEGGHSMMPPQQTAIGILSAAIDKIEQNQFPTRMGMPVRQMFGTLAPEMPFGMRIIFANLWLFEGLVEKKLAASPRTNALIRTTTAPTIFTSGVKENILPTTARSVVNFRLLQGESIGSVMEYVRRTIDDPRVKIRPSAGFSSEPSYISDTGSPGFRAIELTIRQVFPEVLVAPGLCIGATDSRHYAKLTKSIFRFSPLWLRPDDLQRIHGIDERISIENYTKVVKFYTQLIRNSDSMEEMGGAST